MSTVFLAVSSSQWGDDHHIYGIFKTRNGAVRALVTHAPKKVVEGGLEGSLVTKGEYVHRSDVYRVEEWDLEP